MSGNTWRFLSRAIIVVIVGVVLGLMCAHPFQAIVTLAVLAVLSPFFILASWL